MINSGRGVTNTKSDEVRRINITIDMVKKKKTKETNVAIEGINVTNDMGQYLGMFSQYEKGDKQKYGN